MAFLEKLLRGCMCSDTVVETEEDGYYVSGGQLSGRGQFRNSTQG